jgi:hypothetical protein
MPKKNIPCRHGMRWHGALHDDACLCIRQTSFVILQVLKFLVLNSMELLVHQVRKGQQRPAELCIHPDAEVMQGDLCGQARLKPAELMRPFAVEAEGMRELLIHRLHDLAHPSHPASEPLGPRRPAMAFGWADDLGAIGPPPGHPIDLPLEPLVDDVWPTGRGAHARQARMRMATQGKERLCEGLIFGTGRGKAETGDHPQDLVGFQGRGCADGVEPTCCHPFLLEALLFQSPSIRRCASRTMVEHKPPESNKSVPCFQAPAFVGGVWSSTVHQRAREGRRVSAGTGQTGEPGTRRRR